MPIVDDLRFAVRSMRKRPLFTAAVVATLGLGIGANSGVFSLLNALLYAPIPVARPGELVNVYTMDSTGTRFGATSYPDYRWLRDHARAFSGVIGYSGLMTTITGDGDPEVVFGEIVTGNYFAVTGARLVLGRGFAADEDRPPGEPVVVLGYRLWQRRFAADSGIVGRRVTLNGHPFTVIGVAAPEFTGLLFRGLSADLWAPVMMMGQLRTDQLENRDERWMFVKGRLAPAATLAVASVELSTVGKQLAAAFPGSNRGRAFRGLRMIDVHVNPAADRILIPGAVVIIALVSLVLLIACTNIANLMLARAAARRQEIAIRLSLGATRPRLVRQLVTEAGAYGVVGGGVGLLLSYGFARLLVAFRPPTPIPLSLDVSVDGRVLWFTLASTMVACVLFGLVPALRASRPAVAPDLSIHASGPTRRGHRFSMRQAYLLPQVAGSLVLLITAGLFSRSVSRAAAVDPGFDLRHSAFIALNLALDGYSDERAARFYDELSQRLERAPGVRGTAVTDRIPLDLYGNQAATVSVVPVSGGDQSTVSVQFARVGSGYFEALGIRLERGRTFTAGDADGHAPVGIVSVEAARRFWPDRDAVGQHLRDGPELVEIVGVVADTKVQTLGEPPQPFLYRLPDGHASRLLRFVVGTSGNPDLLPAELRRVVAGLDPAVAVFESATMADHLNVMLYPYRAAAALSTSLGVLGLLLASIGLYAVVAFGVARRTREFGIRLALGAPASSVAHLVIRENAGVVLGGIAVGLVLALAVSRLLASVLFGIGTVDPVTFAGVPVILAVTALVATWIPVRRAASVSPAVALRDE